MADPIVIRNSYGDIVDVDVVRRALDHSGDAELIARFYGITLADVAAIRRAS